MSASSKRGPTLRTKSGCLTCRQRRKKCDEAHPACVRCISAQRDCVWPSSEQLKDRRNLTRRTLESTLIENDNREDEAIELIPRIARSEVDLSNTVSEECLQMVVGRHFIEHCYSLLINSDSHPSFHDDWSANIQDSMLACTSLYYSVLANSASHLFISDRTTQMEQRALAYYSHSLRDLSQIIALPCRDDPNRRNDILTSVVFLYLNGCMGHGTYDDIPVHLSAAIRLLDQQFFQADSAPTLMPSQLVTVESVIYQVFLVRMGLWSKPPEEGQRLEFDPMFWLNCEALLLRSTPFPGSPRTWNSPVLGVEFELYKVFLMIRKLWDSDRSTVDFKRAVHQLKTKFTPWELTVGMQGNHCIEGDTEILSVTQDATALFVVGASLLVSQLPGSIKGAIPLPFVIDDSRLLQAKSILKRRAGDQRWGRSHLPNYPLYVLGFFMRSDEDIALVRRDMQQRLQQMAWSMIDRFWRDLESVWSTRPK